MTIKFANLPEGIPWAVGPAGELLLNAEVVVDIEDAYTAAAIEFYSRKD